MPSPIAVESCSLILLMAVSTVLCAVVGGTRIAAEPAIDTMDTLNFSGSWRTKSIAAFFAASSRVGLTSVACMDCEASITSTTVARSRAPRPGSWAGRRPRSG